MWRIEYKERMAETEAFFEDMEADELVELCAVGAISPVVASLANKREFGLATEGTVGDMLPRGCGSSKHRTN